MPLLRSKFQPYFPDPDSPAYVDCGFDNYCHPVQLGDTIMSQFYQTPCAANEIVDPGFEDFTLGAEELTNGTFTGNANGWVTNGGVLPSDGWAYDTNNIRHTAGTQLPVYQTGLALAAGFYEVAIDITRTSGSVRVILGDGPFQTLSDYFDSTGIHTVTVYYSDVADQTCQIEPHPTDDFDGTINSISVKEITYSSWEPNGSWLLEDGFACHISGTTGLLEETVANYIVAGQYYSIQLFVSGYISGTCDVYIADQVAGTIASNGLLTYYDTPTAAGVVSFDPSSDFVGCISFPETDPDFWGLRRLRNDYPFYLTDENGVQTDISESAEYYENYITLQLEATEDIYGCYNIEVVDSCTISGDNLITNGNFADGATGWNLYSGGNQYAFAGGDAEFIFDPSLTWGSDFVTNGDFATGDFTGWTAGANWAVVGNKAVHTPGSTATLVQNLTIPVAPAPPTPEQYWVELTFSAWTVGAITVTFGSNSRVVSPSNTNFLFGLNPTINGSVPFTITPSSTFDGSIDDIAVYSTNTIWSSTPFIISNANTEIVAGNYELSFEILSLSDSRISAKAVLLGQSTSTVYYNTVGVHTISISNYVPGNQQVLLTTNFGINGTIVIDNVELIRVEPFDANYTSECLNIREFQTDTRMIKAYCDQPSFGFEFDNTGFFLQQRVVCRSLNPTYPGTRLIQKSGTGNARVTYADQEKYWIFGTDFASETFHDTFAIQLSCDHLLIGTGQDNGIEYVAEVEEYQPEWRSEGDYPLAPVTVRLRVANSGQKFNRHT